jgi:hypothetical protein
MSSLKIKFAGYKDVGTHVDYLITVNDVQTGESWRFAYRYSFLRSIHETLKKFSPTLKFPSKKLFGNKNSKFLESRKDSLEKYFSAIFSDETLRKVIEGLKIFPCVRRASQEIKPCTAKVVGFCKSCTRKSCLEIVSHVGMKFIDMSCHPGSLSDSEILDQREMHDEKCKDFKAEEWKVLGKYEEIEELDRKAACGRFLCRALDECTDILKQDFCKVND